jgi:hypothetical protein
MHSWWDRRNCEHDVISPIVKPVSPRMHNKNEVGPIVKPKPKPNCLTGRCLTNVTHTLGGFHHMQRDCDCVQPCKENVFETAYSAAAWPANNFPIGDCPEPPENTTDTFACTEYYRYVYSWKLGDQSGQKTTVSNAKYMCGPDRATQNIAYWFMCCNAW